MRLLAVVVGTLLVAALLVCAGYWAGQKNVQAAWDADRAQVNGVLVSLSKQYAKADAEAQQLRMKVRAKLSQRVGGNIHATQSLPDRGCGWSTDELRLLDDTYCASFPGAAGCVYGAVRDTRQAPAGR